MSIIPNVSIDGEDSEVPEKSYLTIENIENIDDAVLDPENVINVLKFPRKKNVNKLIIAHLNINSICNKIDALANIALGSIDILVVTETKFDDTFTNARIKINCYGEPLRVDRNGDGVGFLFLFGKMYLVKGSLNTYYLVMLKFLLVGTYHPPCQTDQYYYECINNNALDLYAGTYEKILLVISTRK